MQVPRVRCQRNGYEVECREEHREDEPPLERGALGGGEEQPCADGDKKGEDEKAKGDDGAGRADRGVELLTEGEDGRLVPIMGWGMGYGVSGMGYGVWG